MFKELESAAIWGLAAGAASSWASRQMEPDSQRPVWQGELNGVVLTVVETNHHGYFGYEVSVIADGWCWSVGRFPTYPQAVAVVQAWDLYLQRGGTVRAWEHRLRPLCWSAWRHLVLPPRLLPVSLLRVAPALPLLPVPFGLRQPVPLGQTREPRSWSGPARRLVAELVELRVTRDVQVDDLVRLPIPVLVHVYLLRWFRAPVYHHPLTHRTSSTPPRRPSGRCRC